MNDIPIISLPDGLIVRELHDTGVLFVNHSTGTFSRKPQNKPRAQESKQNHYSNEPEKIRFETQYVMADGKQPLKVKYKHYKGRVKTSLNALAKAHATYACEQVEAVVSDAKLFGKKLEVITKKGKRFEVRSTLPIARQLRKVWTVSQDVNAGVLNNVGDLFTAVLLFNGRGYEDVKKDIIMAREAGKKSLTYNVNTLVTYRDLQFKVNSITVKKTHEAGIFFCSKSCRPITSIIKQLPVLSNKAETME